ncbi:MAG: hypothetical protein QGH15_12870 [Kiritimatiellia bacterium]|jgi:hypothetical protein|nr:hypothetical protein [Kiritimatiellia bacterium]
MEYLIAAGILAVPLVILVITGRLYYWHFLTLRYFLWGEKPLGFLAYLIVYVSFFAFFLCKGIRLL